MVKAKKLVGIVLCLSILCCTVYPAEAVITPVYSSAAVDANVKAKVDVSNTKDGYIRVAYTGQSNKKIKVRLTGPDETIYTYNLNHTGNYEVFPLSAGEGLYRVGVYENTTGNKYSLAYSTDVNVMLVNEFAPFLRPNQYVNFNTNSAVVKQAEQLTKGKRTDLEKISTVYEYVVTNLTYDKEKAKVVQSGYIPDVDKVLKEKKGICFDYATLMAAMLRSQGIPAKLVIGYTGNLYHAWIDTYIPEKGWIKGVIFFDGSTWKLMDPTFASSSKQSKAIMEYIENSNNYSARFVY